MADYSSSSKSGAPIALFVYARPAHTAETLSALAKANGANSSTLYVFCDGIKGEKDRAQVEEVRRIVHAERSFPSKRIIMQPNNRGLANSIISGVSSVIEEHGRVVVVEDDIVLGSEALRYFNDALNYYEGQPRVMHVAGYVPGSVARPSRTGTFLFRVPFCWGWATWADRWKRFRTDGGTLLNELSERRMLGEFDLLGTAKFTRMLRRQVAGEIDSWFIRWYATTLLASGVAVYPWNSLVLNIGTDGTGSNCCKTSLYDTKISSAPTKFGDGQLPEDAEAIRLFQNFYRGVYPSRLRRLTGRFISIFQGNASPGSTKNGRA